VLILLVFIASTIYHIDKSPKLLIFDKIFAHSLIGYNFYVCYLTNFREPYFLLALIAAATAFWFFFKKGDRVEWHIFSALITVFCVLSYTT